MAWRRSCRETATGAVTAPGPASDGEVRAIGMRRRNERHRIPAVTLRCGNRSSPIMTNRAGTDLRPCGRVRRKRPGPLRTRRGGVPGRRREHRTPGWYESLGYRVERPGTLALAHAGDVRSYTREAFPVLGRGLADTARLTFTMDHSVGAGRSHSRLRSGLGRSLRAGRNRIGGPPCSRNWDSSI